MASKQQYLLTDGEWAWLKRRRRGLNQTEMAEATGKTRHQISTEESVEGRMRHKVMLAGHEEMALVRRRKGLTQDQLAGILGVSRNWVNKMETGSAHCERALLKLDWRN